VEELAPLRHQRILEMDDAGAAEASEQSYAAWKSERESLLTKACEPSLSVRTITSHIRTAGYAAEASGRDDEPRVEIERLERVDQNRSGGRRFGALVHALLASIDLKANVDSFHMVAAVHGRMVGATEDEISAAIRTITQVLQHPILRRAAASRENGLLRRETPVFLRLSEGCLVEGVVDLAFCDDTPGFAGWTVVDFKTDREFEESSDHYIAQVIMYSKAVCAATNSPTRGVLLIV
jgi:ATP-dependent helicase/nuclease subunit A